MTEFEITALELLKAILDEMEAARRERAAVEVGNSRKERANHSFLRKEENTYTHLAQENSKNTDLPSM